MAKTTKKITGKEDAETASVKLHNRRQTTPDGNPKPRVKSTRAAVKKKNA